MTMPFWKKGEDPWDIDPEKRRRPPEETAEAGETGEPAPGLLEELRDWNEARKQKKAESVPPPIPCPWCGKEMERRYLVSGRDPIWLYREKPGFLRGLDEPVRLDEEGSFFYTYKTIWFCPACRKLAADLPEPPEDPSSQWMTENRETEDQETREEET